MRNYTYYQQLNDRNLNLLEDLYKYRAMTTEQIKHKYFSNTKYYINKVLHYLRKDGFIASNTLKGSRKNKKGVAYHRLTEKGLDCLAMHGKLVDGHIQNLYVKPSQLHYILLANELMVELCYVGWEVWDSRRVKKEYSLDIRMNIQGLLIAPDGRRYGFYIMEKGVTPVTLGRIQSEIRDNHEKIKHFIIFVKGELAYTSFINKAINPSLKRIGDKLVQQKPVYTGFELKVMPFHMGMRFYKSFPVRDKWLNFISQYFGFEILSDMSEKLEDGNIRELRGNVELQGKDVRKSFPTIIRYKGEEMYLADLTESDLTLLRKINNYNGNDYQWEKRRILVIRMLEFNESWLKQNNPYVQELIFNWEDVKTLIN